MADRYVSHVATGANNGTSWAHAYTNFLSAASTAVAGDRIYVLNTHYQATTGTNNIALGTTNKASLVQVLSVNAALQCTVGAQVRTAGSSVNSFSGCFYAYGIDFSSEGYGGNSFSNGLGAYTYLEKCTYGNSTGTGNNILLGGYNMGKNEFHAHDSYWTTGGGATYLLVSVARFSIRGGGAVSYGPKITGGPFRLSSGFSPAIDVSVDSFDLSGIMDTTATLFTGGGGNLTSCSPNISRCRLPEGWAGALSNDGNIRVTMDSCDDGGDVTRSQTQDAQGTTRTDVVVKRTGGAEINGVAGSRKFVSDAAAQPRYTLDSRLLFRAFPGNDAEDAAWVQGGPVTVTVEILSNTVLTDAECWLEVTSFSSALSVVGGITSDERDTVTAAGVAQTSSAAVWTTTGLATPVAQKLQVVINPPLKGYITAVVKLAKPNTTVWVCPQLEVS